MHFGFSLLWNMDKIGRKGEKRNQTKSHKGEEAKPDTRTVEERYTCRDHCSYMFK